MSEFADAVREPAVEECLIGGPALGEAQVALALQRFERAEENGLAAAFAAGFEISVERAERARPDAAVGNQIGKILAIIYLTKQPVPLG